MAKVVNGEAISTPTYVLNGVSSRRWIKSELSNYLHITGGNDLSCESDYCLTGTCATNYCGVTGCPTITRAFYNLSEEGEVYLTTANGVIYYLANDTDKMRQIYPVNSFQNIEPVKDNGIKGMEVGVGAVQFELDVSLISDVNIRVMPTRNRIIPWRPGTTKCNISVGERYRDHSYIIQKRSQMAFPTSNGYFCVQTDYDRCVVFYKGELIYDGEYNGMGLPLSFSYGLEKCVYGGNLGCCPHVDKSSIEWNYRVMPKWRQEDGKFVFESPVDKFLKDAVIKKNGKISGSNIFYWDGEKFVSFDGYYADDTYQKIVVSEKQTYQRIKRDDSGMPIYEEGHDGEKDHMLYEEYEGHVFLEKDFDKVFRGYRRFDIYVLDAEQVNGLSRYPIAWFKVPLEAGSVEVDGKEYSYLRGFLGDFKLQQFSDDLRSLCEVIKEAEKLNIDDFINLFKRPDGEYGIGYLGILNKVAALGDGIKEKITTIWSLVDKVVQLVKEVGGAKRLYDEVKSILVSYGDQIDGELNEYEKFVAGLFNEHREGGVRIWFAPTAIPNGTGKTDTEGYDEEELKVFCGLRDEEKIAIPALGCESEMVYRCWEELQETECGEDEHGVSPSYLKWYTGTGYSEGDYDNQKPELRPNDKELIEQASEKVSDIQYRANVQYDVVEKEEKEPEKHEGNKSASRQTLWLSRWRNELCVYCRGNEGGVTLGIEQEDPCPCSDTLLSSNPYTTDNNCKFRNASNNPSVCGKCNYPVTFPATDENKNGEEPCWIHVPDIPELDASGKPVFDANGNPKYVKCLQVEYERDENGAVKLDKDGNPILDPTSGRLTHYCDVAVAKVALDYLGGRVETVNYQDDTPSDWGFIRIGAVDCRIKKDYTVIGQISSPSELPGISTRLARKDGEDLVVGETYDYNALELKYETDPNAANAVILRAPATIDGDREKGCVPGFAEGEGEIVYVMSDKEIKQDYHMRFYHVDTTSWNGDNCREVQKEDESGTENLCSVSLEKKKLKGDGELGDNDPYAVDDGYCLDSYTRSVKYTTKTTATSIITAKDETVYVSSTPKTVFYTAESVETPITSEGQRIVTNYGAKQRTTTLKLKAKSGSYSMFVVSPVAKYQPESGDEIVADRTTDIEHLNDWYKIGGSFDITESNKLNIPSEVSFKSYGVRLKKSDDVASTDDSQTSTEEEKKLIINELGDSGGEAFKPLVLYDIEDFDKEFRYDYEKKTEEGVVCDYVREELTSKADFTYNYDTTKETTSGDTYSPQVCCSGVVTITHKYKIKEPELPSSEEPLKATNTSELYSTHEDTYTIIRKLYAGTGYHSGMSGVAGNKNDKGSPYYTLEETVSRTLTSHRIMSVEGDTSEITRILSEHCADFDSGNKSVVKFILGLVPVLGLAGALTEEKIKELCTEREKYVNKENKTKEDAEEVRREFFRFFPAYMFRPDYSASLNAGVESGDFRWTDTIKETRCDSNIGVPDISALDCTKNTISAPVNIYECSYNVESNELPKLSNSSYYKFAGFTNSWTIIKDKMQEERDRILKPLIEKAIEDAKESKAIAAEEKKKKQIRRQRLEALIQEKIDSGEVSDGFFESDVTLLSDEDIADILTTEEIEAVEDSIQEQEYKLTEAEKNAIVVYVSDIDVTIPENDLENIRAQFKKPDRIIWYAKWNHEYKIKKDLDGNVIDENGFDDDEEVVTDIVEEEEGGGDDYVIETLTETCYVPISSPAGICYPCLVVEAIKNDEQTDDSDGKLTSVKSVTVATKITVDNKGNITEQFTEHPITKDDVGTWFCFGPASDYKSALKNYGGVEKVIDSNVEIDPNADASILLSPIVNDNPYEESAGIKWIQAVNNWGDPHGVAIRGGTEVGDIYYKRTRLNESDSLNSSWAYDSENAEEIIAAIQHKNGREEYIVEKKNNEVQTTPTYLEDLDTDSDKYWYWNGFEWVKGTKYFSDVDGEEVIFYKDEGNLNIAVEDSNEKCLTISEDAETDNGEQTEPCTHKVIWDGSIKKTIEGQVVNPNDDEIINCNDFSKAIFKGRVKYKQACGDILAVNLNADKTYHKAVFMKEKPIWDRPAYEGEDYSDQKEYLKCFGMTYTAVTYNIGPNKQCFRLWYRDYDANDEESEYVSFARDFTYFTEEECEQRKKVDKFSLVVGGVVLDGESSSSEGFRCKDSGDVPDLTGVVVDTVPGSILRKYKGKESQIAKTYLTILSRNKRYVYLFYKGVLIKKYDCEEYGLGSWLELGEGRDGYDATTTAYLSTVQGPKYCIVAVGRAGVDERFKSLAFGGSLGRFDIYYCGTSVFSDVLCIVSNGGMFVEQFRYSFRCYDYSNQKYDVPFYSTYLYAVYNDKRLVLCDDTNVQSGLVSYSITCKQLHGDSKSNDVEYRTYLIQDCGDEAWGSDDDISKEPVEVGTSLVVYDVTKPIVAKYYHVLIDDFTQNVKLDRVELERVVERSESAVVGSVGGSFSACSVYVDKQCCYTRSREDVDGSKIEYLRYRTAHFLLGHSSTDPDIDSSFGSVIRHLHCSSECWDRSADYGQRENMDIAVLVDKQVLGGCAGSTSSSVGGSHDASRGDHFEGKVLVLYVFYPVSGEYLWKLLDNVGVDSEKSRALQKYFSVVPLNGRQFSAWRYSDSSGIITDLVYGDDVAFVGGGNIDALGDKYYARVGSSLGSIVGDLDRLENRLLQIARQIDSIRPVFSSWQNKPIDSFYVYCAARGLYLTASEVRILMAGVVVGDMTEQVIANDSFGWSSLRNLPTLGASQIVPDHCDSACSDNSNTFGVGDIPVVADELAQELQSFSGDFTVADYHRFFYKLSSSGSYNLDSTKMYTCDFFRYSFYFSSKGGSFCWLQSLNACLESDYTIKECEIFSLVQEYPQLDGFYKRWYRFACDVPCSDYTYSYCPGGTTDMNGMSWPASNYANCDDLVYRDLGYGVLFTQGGNSPMYLISERGIKQVGYNQDIVTYEVAGDSGRLTFRPFLCGAYREHCGLFHVEYVGRRIEAYRKDSYGNYIEIDNDASYAGEYGVQGVDTNAQIKSYEVGNIMYKTFTWYSVYYGSVELEYEDIEDAIVRDDVFNDAKYDGSFSVTDVSTSRFSYIAKCCFRNVLNNDVSNNYVVLNNGKVFYKTDFLFDITEYDWFNISFDALKISEDDPCDSFDEEYMCDRKRVRYLLENKLNLSPCCGDGVLFSYNGYQCLFIEGEPVYPFCSGSGENKEPKWIYGKNYSMQCCGYDYYWIQCGDFVDDIEYKLGDDIESMYVFVSLAYSENSSGGYSFVVIKSVSNTDYNALDDATKAKIEKWIADHSPSFSSGDSVTVFDAFPDSDNSSVVSGIVLDQSALDSLLAVFGVGGNEHLKLGETACAAFLRRNEDLRQLEDGSLVQISSKLKSGDGQGIEQISVSFAGMTLSNGVEFDDDSGVDLLSLNYTTKDENDRDLNHYRLIEVPKKWTLSQNSNAVFDDDCKYEAYAKANEGNDLTSLLECVKMEQVRFVPWKHKRTMAGRECLVYYRKKLISTDPRIKEVCCFRYRNKNVAKENDLDQCNYREGYIDDSYKYRPSYHAIGAYAIFEDNPFYNAWADSRLQEFSWTEKGEAPDDSTGQVGSPDKYFEYHYTETPAVQNVLGVKTTGNEHNAEGRVLCDVDDYYVKRGELTESSLIPCDNNDPKVYDSADSSAVSSSVRNESEFITGSLYETGEDTKKFCNLKGITKEAQKNVCMIVWSRGTCQTAYLNDVDVNQDNNDFSSGDSDIPSYFTRSWSDWHKNDEPFDELWDGSSDDQNRNELVSCVNAPSGYQKDRDYWIRRLRSDVIYINDYNAAGRWDRVSGDDPVDDWQGTSRGEFKEVNGGFWTSAPEYYPVQDSYNDNLNPCAKSRLVVSGNNTLYVFDGNGRTDYDLFNGEQRKYPNMQKISPTGE